MALSLTLGAVSAEDAAADTTVAADGALEVEGNAAGAYIPEDAYVADVAVDVEAVNETADEILWGVAAINYGPDTAYDTYVRLSFSDNQLPIAAYYDNVAFYPEVDVWYVGPYYLEALITTDSFDPDLSNNYDIAWIAPDAAAAEETLPETGNPLAMALLALLAVGVGGIKRRF